MDLDKTYKGPGAKTQLFKTNTMKIFKPFPFKSNSLKLNLSRPGILSLCVLVLISGMAHGQSKSDRPGATKEISGFPTLSNPGEGVWLKGDLHVHSRHSKESSNHDLAKIFAYAKSVGFGYIAITDHDNHVLGEVGANTWADPEFRAEDSLLLLYGAEWTTARGHGNTFSAKPYDHKRFYDARDQRDTVIGRVKDELGIHLSANHPSGKDHFGFSFDLVQSIEVWNSSIWPNNKSAVMIWDDMLSSGRRITARGGSDAHHGFYGPNDTLTMEGAKSRFNYIGTPTTWIFAKSKTLQAVVDALNQGRTSISANPYAPRVEFLADLNGDGTMDVMMGDNSVASGNPVKFRVQLEGTAQKDAQYTIIVTKNGRKLGTHQTDGGLAMVEFTDTPDAVERSYYRVSVEGPIDPYPQVPGSMEFSERMVGLSNPIYFNFDQNF